MSERIGNWMQCVSGRPFWVEDPRPEDVDLGDIAHALSMICRFGGHVARGPYTVAEHSVRVSWAIDYAGGTVQESLHGLLHDATEAYLGDVVWPLKRSPVMAGYCDLERRLESVIAERFGLAHEMPAIVKRFDLVLLATEKRDLMMNDRKGVGMDATAAGWHCDTVQPLPDRINPWGHAEAKDRFLRRYFALAALR